MFEKTFSFWQRWMGNAPLAPSVPVGPSPVVDASAACASAEPQEERRLWTRFEMDMEGKIRLSEQPSSAPIPTRIRDLSMGGANLLVNQPFQPGQILSVELLTNEQEVRTILACVVRLIPEKDSQWSVGCVFSRELSSEELSHFEAKKIAADDDQRKWVRFPCMTRASYRKVGDPSNQSHSAQVLNISASGIGLTVTPPLDTGCLLNVDLMNRQGQSVQTLLACVVHTTLRSNGELAVGCNFIRQLNEHELQSLL